jgi:predicted regulator of Ras-like GTPase activity (Roadblock/LC7/MglB family)/Flp pilus assembly protein TadD
MAKEEAEIKELVKKLAQNPDSMVFVQLADAYRRAGELEKSVEVCLEGLERHPTYTTARAILGRNYMDLGRLDDAAGEFRQIEVADPENIMAHRMLGQIFLQNGQFADAVVRQQRVLALDPDDSTAQELLQQALNGAKQADGGAAPAAKPAAPAQGSTAASSAKANDAQSGTLKVAEIYIKKGALDEAAEVLQEILAADPSHAVAQQKLREVNEKRGGKAEDGAKAKAEEAARKKAEEEAKAKAEEAARKKAEEEAKAKAEEAARKKAEEEAKAKAEEAARKKAEEEAKAKAEEAARKKAEEEAKAKAEEAARKKAEEEAKAKAEEAARKKAEEEAREKAEAAAKRAAEDEAQRKASKLSSEDILSVMTGGADELIEDEPAAKPKAKEAPAAKAAEAPAAPPSPELQRIIDDFVKAQAIEACLLMDAKGALLDSRHAGQAGSLGQTAAAIFNNTEKAAGRMNFGGLKQIMIVGEDSRQILFVALKAGVLVALTGKQTNLGLLRVAVGDLVKRA